MNNNENTNDNYSERSDEFNEENNTLSYNQLMEWDKDDLAHCILEYQEEARNRKIKKYVTK